MITDCNYIYALSDSKYKRKLTTLASKKFVINEISERIVHLSRSIKTNKEFLNKCRIANHSLITDIKKGRIKTPGAEVLAQIVEGTGCCGTWLLTGEGEMFDSERNRQAGTGISPILIHGFLGFIEEIEKDSQALEIVSLPDDIDVRVGNLLVKILERRKPGKQIQ